jgi:hypothetical protein
VTRYPAVFVNGTLVAAPNDFGFYGKDETQTGGLYAPLKTEMSHANFRRDLKQAIERVLAGKKPAG